MPKNVNRNSPMALPNMGYMEILETQFEDQLNSSQKEEKIDTKLLNNIELPSGLAYILK